MGGIGGKAGGQECSSCPPAPLAGSVPAIDVPGVDLGGHVGQLVGHAVGHDHRAGGLEGGRIVHHPAAVEFAAVFQNGLVDDHGGALGFSRFMMPWMALWRKLSDPLFMVSARCRWWGRCRPPPGPSRLFQDLLGNEVLAGAVGGHDGFDQVFRHVPVVGQQLLGVLGQAVAAVAETGVVVMVADPRVQPHPSMICRVFRPCTSA